MALIHFAALTLVLVAAVSAQHESFPRNVTKTLTVDNGVEQGTWRREEFCPMGSYAAGFELKYEDPIATDDSGVNAIQLVCLARDPSDDLWYGVADSHSGPWGEWNGRLMCVGASPSDRIFLSQFNLRVEPNGLFGHKAVTNAYFRCSEIDNHFNGYYLEGNGGTEGQWADLDSETCDDDSAICGVAIKFEEPNYIDETATGDAIFYCCND